MPTIIDPADLFQITIVAKWAYPPHSKPVFLNMCKMLSGELARAGTLSSSPFPKGICATLVTAAEESEKPYSYKIVTPHQKLFLSLNINGNELWDCATDDQVLADEVSRILLKILRAVCFTYKLDYPTIEK